MSLFITEFDFELPRGYVDKNGDVHKKGTMRLATAADEILPLNDPRVKTNQGYLLIIIFSRVITRLGDLEAIDTKVIEKMFSCDIAYLQEFYNSINTTGTRIMKIKCPHCENILEVEPESLGG